MKKRVLIIEAHSDDSVISIGGFLEKFRAEYDYHFCLITASDLKVSRQRRLEEYGDYVKYFNGTWWRCFFNKNHLVCGSESLPVDFESNLDKFSRAKLVEKIECVIEVAKPDTLICTGPSFHHDHTAVYESVIAATRPTDRFFPKEIYITENPTYIHSLGVHTDFKPSLYVELTEEQVNKKIEIFQKCFPSQIRESGNYLSADGIKAWARYRGIEARCQYAEALKTFMRVI